MPPKKTKERITKLLHAERRRLEKNLALLTQEEMLVPGVVGEWSMKDVLAHLADWEEHMPAWLEAARSGDPVNEIEPGLNWKQFNEFNQRIYERHKDRPLEEVLLYFHKVHQDLMEMVDAVPEDELLEQGRYSFMGGDAIYTWLSYYAAHDRWAKKHLRKWMKGQGKLG